MFESDQQSPGLHLRQRQQKPDPFNPADPNDDRGEDDDDNYGSHNIQDLSSSHFGSGQCNTFMIHSVAQFLISDVKMDSTITKEANFLDPSIVRLVTVTNELGQSPPAFVDMKTQFIPNVNITPTAPAPAPLIEERDVLLLNCEVETNPAPAISWYMDIQTDGSSVPRLQAHYPPSMTEGTVVEDEDSLSLKCEMDANSEAEITWKKEGDRRVFGNFPVLHISVVSKTDTRTYSRPTTRGSSFSS